MVEGLEEFVFGCGEDLVGDEAGLFGGEAGGGFWGGGGGDPLAVLADFLMAKAEEAEAALAGGVCVVEEGEFESDVEEGLDEVGAF